VPDAEHLRLLPTLRDPAVTVGALRASRSSIRMALDVFPGHWRNTVSTTSMSRSSMRRVASVDRN